MSWYPCINFCKPKVAALDNSFDVTATSNFFSISGYFSNVKDASRSIMLFGTGVTFISSRTEVQEQECYYPAAKQVVHSLSMKAKWKFFGVVVKALSGSFNWFQISNLIVPLKFVSFRILFFFSFDYSLPKDLIWFLLFLFLFFCFFCFFNFIYYY